MKKNKSPENHNYGKYLFAGVLLASIILIFFSQSDDEKVQENKKTAHVWSADTDSMFVKDCYEKYKPQIKDDLVKQETMKLYCRCMLEKVKSEYEEMDLDKVKSVEIKKWDTECRDKILNSNFLK